MSKMNIPVGRIIQIDMGSDKWGSVVYMVVNPPIICEHCDSVVYEWRSSVGDVVCPDCGNIIRHRDYLPCPICGDMDYHCLRVVCNNNWHYDSTNDEVIDYNDKAGRIIYVCGRQLLYEIKKQLLVLLTPNESALVKRKLVWTSSDDYDPAKPMPQAIIDKFPLE